MVCLPRNTSCKDPAAVWTVHSVIKSDREISRTTVNTESFPDGGLPEQYQLGECFREEQKEYVSAVETFSQTYVSTKSANTEIGGAAFTDQTKLIRQENVEVDGVSGLFATHDTYDLADNWNLDNVSTPWDIPYGGAEKFFQQFYMFPEQVTFGSLTVEPCDLLHLFFFVRGGDDPVGTSADWKFRRNGEGDGFFSEEMFLDNSSVALRQVDSDTIGIEVKKSHFLQITGIQENQLALPEFTSDAGVTYVRMYEWKNTVYCATDTDVTALPVLTEVEDAEFMAALTTTMSDEEAVARNLTDLSGQDGSAGYEVENDWGTWVQKLKFYYISQDGQPLHFHDPDYTHIHLNLLWKNLPDKATCPILVWDPTFHALPAVSNSEMMEEDDGPEASDMSNSSNVDAYLLVTAGVCGSVVVILGAWMLKKRTTRRGETTKMSIDTRRGVSTVV